MEKKINLQTRHERGMKQGRQTMIRERRQLIPLQTPTRNLGDRAVSEPGRCRRKVFLFMRTPSPDYRPRSIYILLAHGSSLASEHPNGR